MSGDLILSATIQGTEESPSSVAIDTERSVRTADQGETPEEGFAKGNSFDSIVDDTVIDESSTTASSHNGEGSPVDVLQDPTSCPLIETCREFLDAAGLAYHTNSTKQESTVFSMTMTGKTASFRTHLEIKEAQKRIFVYVICPIKVPEMKLSAVAEFLMRCNYSMALGSFDVDFRDGEVRFRNGIDVEGGVLSKEMVRQLVMLSVATMDRFFGGLMQVVYGSSVPLEAFDECCDPPERSVEIFQ